MTEQTGGRKRNMSGRDRHAGVKHREEMAKGKGCARVGKKEGKEEKYSKMLL